MAAQQLTKSALVALIAFAAAGGAMAVAPAVQAQSVGPSIADRAKQMERRAAMRDAARRRAIEAAKRRGYSMQELRQMTPQERAALARQLREDGALAPPPGWRARMLRRRAQADAMLDGGAQGQQHIRAQVIATDPAPAAIQTAQRNGFRVVRQRTLEPLGVRVVVLAAPAGVSAEQALSQLRGADPQGAYDLNHVFNPSARDTAAPAALGVAPGRVYDGRGMKIGVVDTGVDLTHPALAGARVVTRAFAEQGADRETGHGTAVAALLAGDADGYEGLAPGATLYVADVFGSSGAGGSADAIAEALAWLESQQVDVINISLEGPPNRTLQAVVAALVRRGRTIVAAVGNEGPTAPVAFPAAYDGVIGVTAVDLEQRIYISANRGPQVDLAALGVNVLAASDDGGYAAVSGTSFATPMVAAAMAAGARSADSAARFNRVAAQAVDLGAPGRDPVYGLGALELPKRE